MITFDTHPDRYKHWRLAVEGPVATLSLDVAEDGGIKPGYKLKLNSYDLGVDIELHDALNRIRFEHPHVKCVVLTSAKARMFCAGANIYMLGTSPHAWKVNFCKFTNETRNSMEDSSEASGLKFLAALNGTCAGGGYEVALACDEIVMVDDRSTTVSLPEVPLLGRAARHRRPHPPHRQAQGPPRPRRRLLHHGRRRACRSRQAVEARRPHRAAGAFCRSRAASAPRRFVPRAAAAPRRCR